MKVNKFIAKVMMVTAIVGIIGSCTDLAKIEERLDDLDSKVTANESQISALNKNLEALKHLKDGAVISKVEETTDGYKITLSNGKELTIVMPGGSASDSVFSSVEVVGDVLELTLAEDGSVLQVPIVNGFKFEIRKGESLVDGLQKIMVGNTATYDVVQEGVASAAIVACPAGFDVELTETTLSVTALPQTKASASLSKDLAILVVSNRGLSTLAKMQVEKTEPLPIATFANTTHECFSLNSVELSATFANNADKLHYIIKPASDAAATEDELKANEIVEATDGVATLSMSDLVPARQYVVYYLATDGTKYGELQTYEFSTRAIDENNLYEKYVTGQTITVAGLEINNVSYPSALYICRGTKSRNAGKSGLVFVEAHSEVSASFDSGISGLIVIGTNPALRSNVNRSSVSYLTGTNETNDRFILANINYNASADVFQFNGNNTFEELIVDNCQFSVVDAKSLFKSTSAVNNFKTLTMANSDLGFTGTSYFANMGGASVTTVTLDNNVFYGEGKSTMTAFYLYKGNKIETVEMHSNTFYRTVIGTTTSNDDALFNTTGINIFNVSKNYFVECTSGFTSTQNRYLSRPAPVSGTMNQVEVVNGENTVLQSDNIYVKEDATLYCCNGTKPDWAVNPTPKAAPSQMTDNWDPANGKFILKGYTLNGQIVGARR